MGREDGIVAGKNLYFPPFVRVLIFGADYHAVLCMLVTSHVSYLVASYSIGLTRWK